QTSQFDAKLIGKDRLLDLALLKIQATNLTPLRLGNSLDVKQGELVLAFGSPLRMDNSVSMGVVSAPARQLSEDDPRIYIQTDAPPELGRLSHDTETTVFRFLQEFRRISRRLRVPLC